jgi:hypothetical protein
MWFAARSRRTDRAFRRTEADHGRFLCDLVGSTARSEQLDGEDVKSLVAA